MPKSTIWQHFTSIDAEKKVKCLYCSQKLSVANKSTCTLIRHLTKKHPTLKVRRHSSTEQSSKEDELLVNNDVTDANPGSPEATILEYEIEDSDVEDSENDNLTSNFPTSHTSVEEPSVERNVIAAMTEAKRQIEDALVSIKSSTNKRKIKEEDEYDHFGHVIASKIRKIQDLDKREVVMHSVYNVVYEALMKNI